LHQVHRVLTTASAGGEPDGVGAGDREADGEEAGSASLPRSSPATSSPWGPKRERRGSNSVERAARMIVCPALPWKDQTSVPPGPTPPSPRPPSARGRSGFATGRTR